MTKCRVLMTTSTFNKKKPRHRPILKRTVYRSRLEDRLADQMEDHEVPFAYEKTRFEYTVPAREAKYTPDFHLNGKFFIEGKGWPFEAVDRQKMVLVKEQHPDLDLRIVFEKAHNPIYKGSKTTFAQWAESHGFKWADKCIPDEWLEEAK